jgi:hypothetical protein
LPPDNYLPSPIFEESPTSILREWKNNDTVSRKEDEENKDKGKKRKTSRVSIRQVGLVRPVG